MVKRFFLPLTIAFFSVGGPSHAESSTSEPAITQQIVRLKTSDGVVLPAVLMHPAAGINAAAPAIVMQHGGPSGHAARSIGAYRFVAERLAALGYTTLSPVSRQSNGYYRSLFEDVIQDLAAAVDWVHSLGHDRIVLLGHSIGSLRITRYQLATADPRIKAQVHFAPTADMYPLYAARPEFASILERAQSAVRAGRGGWPVYPDSVDPDPSLSPVLLSTARGRPQTAAGLLNWWGPEAKTSNSDLFGQLEIPLLLLGGAKDPVVPPGRLEALKAKAVKSPRVDYRWYPDGDHYFTGLEDATSRFVADWLEEIGLGPGVSASTRLIDAKLNVSFAPGGERVAFPGVLYETAADDSSKPFVIYLYRQGGQILEEPIHNAALGLAHRGYRGLAPMLRSSGFRGPLTRPIAEAEEDLADWVASLRAEGMLDPERQLLFLTYGESLIWALRAIAKHEIGPLAGVVALAPPPDLPRYAQRALGESRYQSIVEAARALAADPEERERFVAEKYLRPPPALKGSSDIFLHYPEAFIDFYAPEADTYASRLLGSSRLPALLLVPENDPRLSQKDRARLTTRRVDSVTLKGVAIPSAADGETIANRVANWVEGRPD